MIEKPASIYGKPNQSSSKPSCLSDGVKRLFDILVSAVGLFLLAPFILYIAHRIKRDTPGPAFYRGMRVGYKGKTFQILKFRTMYEQPGSYQGPRVTARDDPRVTPLGRWLRETKINELPQLINVLRGEMSLVGPRPEDPEIVATWPEDVRQEILSVRPGITSPASVLYRDEENLLRNSKVMDIYLSEVAPSKMRLDQLYVRYRSFWSDLDILFWTFLVFIPAAKSYSPPEQRLLLGPLWRLMRRHVSWFLIDALVTFFAIGITGVIWRSFGPLDVGWLPALLLAGGFAVLFSIVNAILGVNRIAWSKAAATDVLDLIPGVFLATILALLGNYYFPAELLDISPGRYITPWGAPELLPTSLILVASGLAFLGFVVARYRSRLITGLATRWTAWRGTTPATQERVLIIGAGETGQFAAWLLNNPHSAQATRVIGFVDDDLYKQDIRIHGFNVLGRRTDIPDLVVKYDIGIIVFAIHNISPEERRQVLNICASTPARVFLFPDIPTALRGISATQGKQFPKLEDDNRWLAMEGDESVLSWFSNATSISCTEVDGWLANLEQLAQNGDLQRVREEIQKLRKALRSDVTVQQAADVTNKEP